MQVLITAPYVMVAFVAAALADFELRLILRFLKHRAAIRQAALSAAPLDEGGLPPTAPSRFRCTTSARRPNK